MKPELLEIAPPWPTVVVEDQTLFRELLVKTISADGRFQLAGQADNGRDGLELCVSTRPHLILLDVHLPQLDGLQMAERLFSVLPDARILALTSLKDDRTITKVVESGFAGYVEKDQPFAVLEAAMVEVARGGTYFTPSFVEARRRLAQNPTAFHKLLSRREQEVLQLVASGCSNTQVAERLKLSPRTAGNHRYNVMKKLELHDVTDLVAFAIRHGFRMG